MVPGVNKVPATSLRPTTGSTPAAPADASLWQPPALGACATDDLVTAIAVLQIKARHDERVASDQEKAAASKSQEEAQARKVEEMRKLADDTFAEGVVTGAFDCAAGVATAASAVTEFKADTKKAAAEADVAKGQDATALASSSRSLTRDAKLLDASAKGFSAASHFGGAVYKSDEENDRADTAQADADIDRAKSAAESAAAASRRADDDIRDTINAIRGYVEAKEQAERAALFRA